MITAIVIGLICIAILVALFVFSGDDDVFEKTVGIIAVAWTLFCIAVTVGIVYVAIHFISKYW